MAQECFSPLDYGFRWVGDWYEFDAKTAEKAARKARDARARELAKRGCKVSRFSLRGQLRTVGGIGSGRPEISVVTTGYWLNVDGDPDVVVEGRGRRESTYR